jgi:hypothetical protein
LTGTVHNKVLEFSGFQKKHLRVGSAGDPRVCVGSGEGSSYQFEVHEVVRPTFRIGKMPIDGKF